MRYGLLILLTATTAVAAPTTRPREIAPKDPPAVSFVGQVVDPTRPAYVPAFTTQRGPSALQTERDYATRLSPPAFGYFGSFGGYGYCGPFFGGYGYGYVNNGFYR